MSKLSEAIPNRVRALRQERGWSLAELADRAGTTASQIMKLEKSQRRLDFDWVERLATAFGITDRELISDGAITPRPVRMVPLVGDIAAGNWREAIANSDGFVAAVEASENAFALRARGNSMDQLVPDGGYVIVEPDLADLREGKVYAIMNGEGETTVKRYRADPARLEPCSTDPSHQPISLGRTPYTVIGQVTGAFMPL
jgi:repressor LexA